MSEKVGLQAVFEDDNFKKGFTEYVKSLGVLTTDTENAANDISKSSQKAGQSWEEAGKQIAMASAAIGGSLVAVMTKSTLTAARTQELGIVVNTVGRNIGKTSDEMNAYVEGVKDMGITTQAARQAVTQMVQAQIDLSSSTELARLAQDAAVIAQIDSSQAFEDLITVIQRGSPVMARTLGLTVDFQGAYEELADTLHTTANDLTNEEKIQARLNEVMKNSNQIAGTYEAAMTSAGKQMRSMTRYVQEAENALGEALLPVMGMVVTGATDMLKGFNALSPAIQRTIAEVGAGAGGLLTFGAAALFAIPKIIKLGQAVQALGATSLLGPVGLIAAAATAAIYLHNLEQAHIAESAETLNASENYRQYITKLDESGRSAYALSEALYELVKAQDAGTQAIYAESLMKAKKELVGFIDTFQQQEKPVGEFGQRVRDLEDQLTDLDLVILRDKDSVAELGTEMGYTGEELNTFVRVTLDAAQATYLSKEATRNYNSFEKERYAILRQMIPLMKGSADETRKTTQANGALAETYKNILALENPFLNLVEKITLGLEHQADATEELTRLQKGAADAIKDLKNKYGDFYSTLSGGLNKLGDMSTAATDSTADYNDAVSDLNASVGEKYAAIREKYENSLPDKTAVSDRLNMIADTWDEWGLRLQDIMSNGIESPWYQMLQDMGYEKPPDVGIKEWAAGIQAQFYEGNLPELLNIDADAWIQHAARVKAAQEEETNAVNQEAAKRKTALDAEREAELAAQEQARQQYMLELSMSLLEESGLLKQWAQERFGGMADVIAPDAEAVLSLLQSGVLEMDNSLLTLLSNTRIGIEDTLDSTGKAAAENKAILDDFFATDWGAEADAKSEELQRTLDLKKMLPPEDVAEVFGPLNEELDNLVNADPLGILDANFVTAKTSIEANATEMVDNLNAGLDDIQEKNATVTEDMGTAWMNLATQILDRWITHSVVSDMETGADDMKDAWGDSAVDIEADFKQLEKTMLDILKRVEGRWNDVAFSAVKAIDKIIDELKKIPSQIVTMVYFQYGGQLGADTGGTEGVAEEGATGGGGGGIQEQSALFGLSLMRRAAITGQAVGTTLGDEIVKAIQKKLKSGDWFEGLVMEAGSGLGGLANFFSRLFEEQSVDPLIDALGSLDDEIDDVNKSIASAEKALATLGEKRKQDLETINDLKEDGIGIDGDLVVVNRKLAKVTKEQEVAQAALAEANEKLAQSKTAKEYAYYTDLAQKASEKLAESNKELLDLESERDKLQEKQKDYADKADRIREIQEELAAIDAEALENQADYEQNLKKIADLEKERAKLQKEYEQRQQHLADLQKAQADMDFLEQQFKLIEFIREYGLDEKSLLGGVQLGLGADVGQLMDIMTQALQAITGNLNRGLGGSTGVSPLSLFGASLGGVSNTGANVTLGPTTINNGMDEATFEARVTRAVQKALRGF